jgi:4-hydroxy-3-methylbut-2-enyl diphosphate reductase
VRNLEEARQLGALIASRDPAERARFFQLFAGRHTPGFDPERHLERVAVVNQTTLLMNETLAIIEHLREVCRARYGDDGRVGGSGRRDTLCYATQVNQDALSRALQGPLDAALVIGGRNSSNTYQLFRLCEERLGARASFIQSEASIAGPKEVAHYVYLGGHGGRVENRSLWEGETAPRRILLTGGASCPDGIIQQVITRINGFFPAGQLRTVEDVLRDLQAV